jgi:hypothetical protein
MEELDAMTTDPTHSLSVAAGVVLCGLDLATPAMKRSLKTRYPSIKWDAYNKHSFKRAIICARRRDTTFFSELHRLVHMCYDPEEEEWMAFAEKYHHRGHPVGLYLAMVIKHDIDVGFKMSSISVQGYCPIPPTLPVNGLVVPSRDGGLQFEYKP